MGRNRPSRICRRCGRRPLRPSLVLEPRADGQGNSTTAERVAANTVSPLVVNQMKPMAQACRIQAGNNQEESKKKPAQLERRRLLAERLKTILRPPNLLFGRAVCAQNPRSSKKPRAVARLFAGHLILIGRYKVLVLCVLRRHHMACSADQIVAIPISATSPFGRECSRSTVRGWHRILSDPHQVRVP